MRYLGIDFGTKKLGLALSDEAGTMGFPHSVISNTPQLLADIRALIEKENVGAVVMGESIGLSGEENPVAKDAHAFAQSLTEETGLPVHFEPEMFTTQEARRLPEGEREIMGNVDAQAASLILTSYLGHHERN